MARLGVYPLQGTKLFGYAVDIKTNFLSDLRGRVMADPDPRAYP
jgi:hypothetical protein